MAGDLAEAVFSRHFRVRSESWTWQYPGKPPHLGLSPATDYQNAVTANMVKHSKEEWRSCGDVVRSRWIMYNHRHFLSPLSDNTVAKSPPMSSLENFSSRNWLVQKLLIRVLRFEKLSWRKSCHFVYQETWHVTIVTNPFKSFLTMFYLTYQSRHFLSGLTIRCSYEARSSFDLQLNLYWKDTMKERH